MSVNLTVILGAGAATDVINPISKDARDPIHQYFRPPVTADLFQTHHEWESEYAKFPAVASVVGEIRNAFPKKRNSVDIENFLKQLKDSPRAHRNAQFREFPLYLQHYFSSVSELYCKKPSNYLTLINQIFDLEISKVVFVTTNYDLLLDKALEIHPSTSFSVEDLDIRKYIKENNWAYIKLHGSVNWGRKIDSNFIKNRGNTLSALVDNVRQFGSLLESSLEQNIIIDNSYKRIDRRQLIYPAISVPVGESKLNCPDDHINLLRQHLNNCSNYLIIGFSGYDEDLLKFLDEKSGSFGMVYFVSSSLIGANEVKDKFEKYGKLRQKLQNHIDFYSGNGFDEFIRSPEGLHKFLSYFH